MKITKNSDSSKNNYTGYDLCFDEGSEFGHTVREGNFNRATNAKLKIDSTLWATPSKLVNLLDFKPDKISIKTESNTKNDIKVHKVRYENGGFYLIIDNLEGYFDFSNNAGSLNMLFVDNDQQNKYYQVWKEILKIINGGYGELKSSKEIGYFIMICLLGMLLKYIQ